MYVKNSQNPPEYIQYEKPKNVLYKLLQKAEQKTRHTVEFDEQDTFQDDNDRF